MFLQLIWGVDWHATVRYGALALKTKTARQSTEQRGLQAVKIGPFPSSELHLWKTALSKWLEAALYRCLRMERPPQILING